MTAQPNFSDCMRRFSRLGETADSFAIVAASVPGKAPVVNCASIHSTRRSRGSDLFGMPPLRTRVASDTVRIQGTRVAALATNLIQ
jgi:hypothetical protein